VVVGGEFTPEQRRVLRVEQILRRDGGSPGSALEGLAAIVEEELWHKVPSKSGVLFTSFRAFVEANPPFGLGYSTKQLGALLQLQHPHEKGSAEVRERMAVMRAQVARLIKGDAEPLAPAAHAGPGRGKKTDDATIGFQSNSADYVISRLKRDDPALAERVINGELTANAAARQAGIRKPRIVLTSPASIAAALRRNLSEADVAELARLLAEQQPA
jgi:hypothetical protein